MAFSIYRTSFSPPLTTNTLSGVEPSASEQLRLILDDVDFSLKLAQEYLIAGENEKAEERFSYVRQLAKNHDLQKYGIFIEGRIRIATQKALEQAYDNHIAALRENLAPGNGLSIEDAAELLAEAAEIRQKAKIDDNTLQALGGESYQKCLNALAAALTAQPRRLSDAQHAINSAQKIGWAIGVDPQKIQDDIQQIRSRAAEQP